MNNITIFEDHCCGCGVCATICPEKAITMRQDSKGFSAPVVKKYACIECGLCVKRCSFNREYSGKSPQEAFAVKHTDEKVRACSRSGGVFTALSDQILEAGGVVYGCKLENCREAIHTRATTKEERDMFRGSKYIQSKTHEIFRQVKLDLESGLNVLFSGTPCQVNAVREYCANIDTSKLFLIDIVCHGVPSPQVWKDYLNYRIKQKRKPVVSVDFRDKQNFGWASHRDTVVFSDGSKVSDTIFTKLFYSHRIIRGSCFSCPFKNLNRTGDITIADCWGITEHYPEFDDNKGVSLVLVNTDSGMQRFSRLADTEYIKVDLECLMQPSLKENWPKPVDYDVFWKYYNRHTFSRVVNRYVVPQESYYIRIKHWLKMTLLKAIRIISK